MRLPVERFAGCLSGLVLVAALAGCGSHEDLASASPPSVARANGPAADYPVVIGEPYRVGSTLYTPVDTMNYDEVGYVAADNGAGVTGSHHTLPLPSYVEVTSLVTGRTILVRIERRGPMTGTAAVALSPAAMAQLGASAGDPVRVRRVNPPEAERAALRAGRSAPARMDTPATLVAVLKQKLPAQGSANLAQSKPAAPAKLATVEVPPSAARPASLPTVDPARSAPVSIALAPRPATGVRPPALPPLPSRDGSREPAAPAVAVFRLPPQAQPQQPAESTPAAKPEADGRFIVQAAAMSSPDGARRVASAIRGSVSKAGAYYRVRTGPFATREQAEASLAKVRAAGYSDARILTNG